MNLAGNQTDNTWALEESMDVEWAHAIAPGEDHGRGGRSLEPRDEGAAEPVGRRQHCAEHAGRGGDLDELGVR